MAKLLRPQRPNAGLRKEYERKLLKLLDEMQQSVEYWLLTAYRQNAGRIAQDAAPPSQVPASWMAWALKRLQRRWLRRWRDRADRIAKWFVTRSQSISQAQSIAAMKAAGFTVQIHPSRVLNDTVKALIAENVSLIRSIPQQFFQQVESLVQRSIIQGRDVASLRDELQGRFGVTRNRAKLIARDQSNKAFQAIKRAENQQLGIKEGIWVHVPGTKSSRKTHMRMNGKRFKLNEGLYDSDVKRKVLPGELVACNCVYRAVIPEFGD